MISVKGFYSVVVTVFTESVGAGAMLSVFCTIDLIVSAGAVTSTSGFAGRSKSGRVKNPAINPKSIEANIETIKSVVHSRFSWLRL